MAHADTIGARLQALVAGEVPPEKTYLGVPFFGFDWTGAVTRAVYPGKAAELTRTFEPQIERGSWLYMLVIGAIFGIIFGIGSIFA